MFNILGWYYFVNFHACFFGWRKLPSICLCSVACFAACLCAADGGVPGGAKGCFCSTALLSEFLGLRCILQHHQLNQLSFDLRIQMTGLLYADVM